jgi:hypothetical protein
VVEKSANRLAAPVGEPDPGKRLAKFTGSPHRWEVAMKNLGIVAIFAGILVIILALVGVVGQGGAGRSVIVAAIILLLGGYFLYRRGQRSSP